MLHRLAGRIARGRWRNAGPCGPAQYRTIAGCADPSKIVPALLTAIDATHPGNLTADDVTVLFFVPMDWGAGDLRSPASRRSRQVVASIARSLLTGRRARPVARFQTPQYRRGGHSAPSTSMVSENPTALRNDESPNVTSTTQADLSDSQFHPTLRPNDRPLENAHIAHLLCNEHLRRLETAQTPPNL